MSAFVKLGKQTARRILSMMERWQSEAHPQWRADADELRRALAPSTKRTRARAAKQAQKTEKRQTKAEETREIRDAVLERDGHRCVICGRTAEQALRLEMDHFWPKGRTPQSVETCWTLCTYDHASKTRNSPSAAWWLERFANHARQHGYAAQVKRATDRLRSLADVAAAAQVSGRREAREERLRELGFTSERPPMGVAWLLGLREEEP